MLIFSPWQAHFYFAAIDIESHLQQTESLPSHTCFFQEMLAIRDQRSCKSSRDAASRNNANATYAAKGA